MWWVCGYPCTTCKPKPVPHAITTGSTMGSYADIRVLLFASPSFDKKYTHRLVIFFDQTDCNIKSKTRKNTRWNVFTGLVGLLLKFKMIQATNSGVKDAHLKYPDPVNEHKCTCKKIQNQRNTQHAATQTSVAVACIPLRLWSICFCHGTTCMGPKHRWWFYFQFSCISFVRLKLFLILNMMRERETPRFAHRKVYLSDAFFVRFCHFALNMYAF